MRVRGRAIALDSSDRAFVTGAAGPGMPLTADAADSTIAGTTEAYVMAVDAAGATLEYATYLGGSASELGTSVALDTAGDVYVAGLTQSSDFPTTAGAFDTSFNGGDFDGFVAKIDLALPTLFQSFSVKANAAGNNFEIKGTFTLAAGTDGINPLTEEVRLQAGTASYVIPAGSFKQDKKGRYKFDSRTLEMVIEQVAGRTYSIKVDGRGSLSGNISLSIGNDREPRQRNNRSSNDRACRVRHGTRCRYLASAVLPRAA